MFSLIIWSAGSVAACCLFVIVMWSVHAAVTLKRHARMFAARPLSDVYRMRTVPLNVRAPGAAVSLLGICGGQPPMMRCMMQKDRLILPLTVVLLLVATLSFSSPARASAGTLPLNARANPKHYNLSYPVRVSTLFGAETGVRPAGAFPGMFCADDMAYIIPFHTSRGFEVVISQTDHLVTGHLIYLWCPATMSRLFPNGLNFSGGWISSADGQCHTIDFGMPIITGYYLPGHSSMFSLNAYSGATLVQQGNSLVAFTGMETQQRVCPGRVAKDWSTVADARSNYLGLFSVDVVFGPASGTGFTLQTPYFR